MFNAKFFLNGQPVENPANYDDLEIELNFDKDSPDARVSLTKWRFVLEDSERVQDYVDLGLVGGVGIFEGMPFKVRLEDGADSVDFNFFLDLTSEALFSCEDSTFTAKESRSIDWFNDNVDSFSFEYLFEVEGIIKKADFVQVPYVISTVPNYREALMAFIGFFVVSQELRNAFQKMSEALTDLPNPFTAPTALIKAILFIVYFATVLIALVKLVGDMITLLIQPVKYHAGMYAKKLFEAGLEHLGLTLQSSIFDDADFEDLFVLPRKYANPKDISDDRLLGFVTPNTNIQKGFPGGTFGDFVRALKDMFNAKVIIDKDSGTAIFERVDHEINKSTLYQIPAVEQRFFTTNADELNSTYLIEFATDLNDKNTIDEYDGTIVQVNTVPKTILRRENLTMRGFKNVSIPFALAKRKENLTLIEEIVKGFLSVISTIFNVFVTVSNAVINAVNGIANAIKKLKKVLNLVGISLNINIPPIKPVPPANFGSIINDRIGMMKLENDFVNTPKMMILRKGSTDRKNKIDENNSTILSAVNLWNKFHFVNSFVQSSAPANQWIIKEIENVPFCFEDFQKVKDNSEVLDPEGNEARIESVKWRPAKQTAVIRYRKRQKYTDNLRTEIIQPDGR